MKIISIVGARPQFIKLASLSAKLKENHQEIIIHTGQHYDYTMSGQIFEELGIRSPDVHLGIGSGSHAFQTAEMMKSIESALNANKPDLVIVFGDTNSTLAGALATSKLNIPLLHIEAGLRSFNKQMPEEINRVVTDHVSDYLFAPTPTAVKNLLHEGKENHTYLTGDIMVDTMENNLTIALEKSQILPNLNLKGQEFYLLTLHRDYNVDDPNILNHILKQLEKLPHKILFPVHPRTKKVLLKLESVPKNIQISEPLGYLDFIVLENACKKIITDSGGIQKEAYILQKPCITLRTETEWTETVDEKWNLLVSPLEQNLAEKINEFTPPTHQNKIFGQDVAQKMTEIISTL